MRILVRDGEPYVVLGESSDVWATAVRPLDKPPYREHPEDREAREAWERLVEDQVPAEHWSENDKPPDGLYELVEEHHGACCSKVHRVGCACPAGWPRKTLRRCDADQH